jgi:3-dehydroquinate synthase
MNMETVSVALGARAYDIVIGDGVLAEAGAHIRPHLARPRTVIVTDANLEKGPLAALTRSLAAAGIAAPAVVVPPGEGNKSFAGLEKLIDALILHKVERRDVIIALGGGVVGDLTGFAAAILRRGVGFIQVPTTLLAQVDSSVGGKTGINTGEGKNLVGAFHQPRLVLADVAQLDSLPAREMRAGYAEVVKYALLGDAGFFDWLEANGAKVLAGNRAAQVYAVATSCRHKARIVAADEREEGQRALLNLGHTFGHALEAATGFGARLLHGEAVAIGMVLAFELSAKLGLCAEGEAARVRRHLAALSLPVGVADIPGPRLDPDVLIRHMQQDKKVADGRLTFVLTKGIGRAFLKNDVPAAAVSALLEGAVAA